MIAGLFYLLASLSPYPCWCVATPKYLCCWQVTGDARLVGFSFSVLLKRSARSGCLTCICIGLSVELPRQYNCLEYTAKDLAFLTITTHSGLGSASRGKFTLRGSSSWKRVWLFLLYRSAKTLSKFPIVPSIIAKRKKISEVAGNNGLPVWSSYITQPAENTSISVPHPIPRTVMWLVVQ